VAKSKKTHKDAVDNERGDETAAGDPPEQESAKDAAERKFVEDTLIRGEAAEADAEGKLPPDATHEIVEEHEGELPTIRRKRFKAF
jgi:hypothetical protein